MRKRFELPKFGAGGRAKRPLADEVRFIRTWIESPRLTGAVSPSGRPLARAMARAVSPGGEGLVVELGPGTGPVTRALIEHGVDEKQLVLVEYEAAFCRLLRQRFPGARVLQGDAFSLRSVLAELGDAPIRAVVSSLPLLNQPAPRRVALVEEAFALMAEGGVFVQFTYGLASPVPRSVGGSRFSGEASAPIWLNLPPARVWVYRADATAVRASGRLFARWCERADHLGAELAGKAGAASRLLRARRARLGATMRARAKDILVEARRRRPLDIFRDGPRH